MAFFSRFSRPTGSAMGPAPAAAALTARSAPALQLVPVPLSIFFALMVLVACLAVVLLAARLSGLAQVPGAAVPIPTWIVLTLVPLAALAWWLELRRNRALHLEADALLILGFPQPSRFELADLDLERARILDLEASIDWRPSLYSNHNVATPGLRHGRFRLRNGQRAFVVTSHGSRVLWIPPARAVRDHAPGLMLQPRDPAALLELLRTQAAANTLSG